MSAAVHRAATAQNGSEPGSPGGSSSAPASSSLPGSSSIQDCTIMVDASAAAAAAAGKDAAAVPVSAAATPAPRAPAARTYWIDWLRVFLTVLVVLHHCVTSYLTKSPWGPKSNDTTLWLLTQLFVNGNQTYFMTLFFFLSGLYVPGSLARKGWAKFLEDRTLRLVVPCIVYSMLVPPFNIWWKDAAAKPGAHMTVGEAFVRWLKPTGWPTTYILPTGPPWFVWMLWCFNVAYVVLAALAPLVVPARWRGRRVGASDGRLPEAAAAPAPAPRTARYTSRQMYVWGATLTAVFTALCYAVRVLDTLAFNVRPAMFVQQGPFVAFMPDYFVVYVVAFGLGTFSGPKGWNVLARLPSGGWAGWLLLAGGVWWVQLGWLPNIVLHPAMSMQRGTAAFFGSWALRTFVEQSFCVVWSAGLLILFRDGLNARPGRVGTVAINAAYGAYLVHPVLVALFSRAMMVLVGPSVVLNAAAISCPTVITSWLVAAGLRALPGAHRVL